MVITWFDILLVTLLAAVTALGIRRGVAGLAWGVGGLAVAWIANAVANALGLGPLVSLALGLALGVAMSFGVAALLPRPLEQPWHLLAGGAGGLLLGMLTVSSLALAFPLQTKGKQTYYPSPALAKVSPALYDGIAHSAIQQRLSGIWVSSPALRTLVVPDWK